MAEDDIKYTKVQGDHARNADGTRKRKVRVLGVVPGDRHSKLLTPVVPGPKYKARKNKV